MKYYVVWKGHKPGIYTSWEECQQQIKGFPGAKYKSYKTLEQAKNAFEQGAEQALKKQKSAADYGFFDVKPIAGAIAVDAACSGNPGLMEYRGVYVKNGQQLFHQGPFQDGTNNIGEFLAIVHALAYLKQKKLNLPIYSDSQIAISWVKQKKCKTNLRRTGKNDKIFELIERAEHWLQTNSYENPILKWDTARWGEIPADFGRK